MDARVQDTLEDEDTHALEGVEDGEDVGQVDVIDGEVEQPKDPC